MCKAFTIWEEFPSWQAFPSLEMFPSWEAFSTWDAFPSWEAFIMDNNIEKLFPEASKQGNFSRRQSSGIL
jgi:hypothetical protein